MIKKLRLSHHKRGIIVSGALSLVLAWVVLFHIFDTSPIDSFIRCADAGNPVSETNPPTCTEGSRYYVGPAATPEPSTEAMRSLSFQILVDGDSGGNFPRSSQLINDQTSWEEFWGWIHNSKSVMPPLLPVDFTTDSVIAISEGREQTTGYIYKVTNVSVGKERTVVDIRESIPTITCTVNDIPVNRYFIIRTAKVREPISYRISSERRKCS
jgi:hypothetical protein